MSVVKWSICPRVQVEPHIFLNFQLSLRLMVPSAQGRKSLKTSCWIHLSLKSRTRGTASMLSLHNCWYQLSTFFPILSKSDRGRKIVRERASPVGEVLCLDRLISKKCSSWRSTNQENKDLFLFFFLPSAAHAAVSIQVKWGKILPPGTCLCSDIRNTCLSGQPRLHSSSLRRFIQSQVFHLAGGLLTQGWSFKEIEYVVPSRASFEEDHNTPFLNISH